MIGLLNFACQVIVPGRAFLRRRIDLTRGVRAPHHYIRLNQEVRKDLHAWWEFIESYNGKAMLFSSIWEDSEHLHLYTDASNLGIGAIRGTSWFYGKWENSALNQHISVRELFPLVLAVETWGVDFQNKCIMFHSDNSTVVQVVNNQSARDSNLMSLIRRLVLVCLRFNILVKALHIPGILNTAADMLSRFQVEECLIKYPQANREPDLPVTQTWTIS